MEYQCIHAPLPSPRNPSSSSYQIPPRFTSSTRAVRDSWRRVRSPGMVRLCAPQPIPPRRRCIALTPCSTLSPTSRHAVLVCDLRHVLRERPRDLGERPATRSRLGVAATERITYGTIGYVLRTLSSRQNPHIDLGNCRPYPTSFHAPSCAVETKARRPIVRTRPPSTCHRGGSLYRLRWHASTP